MASGAGGAAASSTTRPGPYSQKGRSEREVKYQLFEDSQILEVAEGETRAPMAAEEAQAKSIIKKRKRSSITHDEEGERFE